MFKAEFKTDSKSTALIQKKLKAVGESLDRQNKLKLLRPPSNKIIVPKMAEAAPISKKPHDRTIKGKWVATYYPGNTRRSMRAMTFRKSERIHTGPKKLSQGRFLNGQFRANENASGHFNSRTKVDAWYAHFPHFGTKRGIPRRAYSLRVATSVQPRVKPELDKSVTRFIKRVAKKKGLKTA